MYPVACAAERSYRSDVSIAAQRTSIAYGVVGSSTNLGFSHAVGAAPIGPTISNSGSPPPRGSMPTTATWPQLASIKMKLVTTGGKPMTDSFRERNRQDRRDGKNAGNPMY
jgi:hypothetical protein